MTAMKRMKLRKPRPESVYQAGYMNNGMCAGYSYGKSGTGYFLDGGFKMGTTLNLSKGNALNLGVGYEARRALWSHKS